MRPFAFLALFLSTARIFSAEWVLDLGQGVTLPMVLIPQGRFIQGSPQGEANRSEDETQREVTLTRDFYLAKTAVTRAQWERFVAETRYRSEAESGPSGGFGWDGSALTQRKEYTWRNPGFPQGPDHPATILTYPDALAFCAWLSSKAKRRIMLPTEAQWEYACRAGTQTAWHTSELSKSAWHKGNSNNRTHAVSSTPANAWGLHIGGNVSEWCEDWYAPYASGSGNDPLQTNSTLSDKPRRVLRGGSWNRDAKNTRSAARFRSDPKSRNADIGFRIAATTEEVAIEAPDQKSFPLPPSGASGVKPTQLPEPSAPASVPTSESTGSMSAWVIVGIFAVLVFLIIRTIWRCITRMVSGVSVDNAGGLRQPPRQASNNLSASAPPKVRPSIRIADDGFWVVADFPRGTIIQYIFRPPGGMDSRGEINYEPGPQGQFVYTGAKPASVRIVSIGGVSMDNLNFGSSTDRSSFRDPGTTPLYPSAY